MDLVSIIVPVYNAQRTLKRCIVSILNQTYPHIELVLINDGSKDKSGIICDEYARKDSRVKVIHKENGGVSSARNLGMDNATGKYFLFVDSDDWISRDAVQIHINAMQCDGVELSATRWMFIRLLESNMALKPKLPFDDSIVDLYKYNVSFTELLLCVDTVTRNMYLANLIKEKTPHVKSNA